MIEYWMTSNRTSTTSSCSGPLRAQIFQKVCFYEQKYDFWPIRTRFDPFKGTFKFIIFNIFFSNIRFLSFIVAFSLFAKNSVPMMKSVTFGSLGPLLPFLKAHPPKLIKNGNVQKWYFLLFSFVTLSLPAKNYVSINKFVIFFTFGPLLPFLKGSPIFKNKIFLFYFVTLRPLIKNYVSITKTVAFSPLGSL